VDVLPKLTIRQVAWPIENDQNISVAHLAHSLHCVFCITVEKLLFLSGGVPQNSSNTHLAHGLYCEFWIIVEKLAFWSWGVPQNIIDTHLAHCLHCVFWIQCGWIWFCVGGACLIRSPPIANGIYDPLVIGEHCHLLILMHMYIYVCIYIHVHRCMLVLIIWMHSCIQIKNKFNSSNSPLSNHYSLFSEVYKYIHTYVWLCIYILNVYKYMYIYIHI